MFAETVAELAATHCKVPPLFSHVMMTGGFCEISSYCAPMISAELSGFCVGGVLDAPSQVSLNAASEACKFEYDVAALVALAAALEADVAAFVALVDALVADVAAA